MVMKDKLEKFGHKRGYYLARKTFFGFLACLVVFSMVAIPTYIASRAENSISQAKAIEDEDSDDADIQSVDEDK